MSYDLAVWEGDRPVDDADAAETFRRLYDGCTGTDERTPPSPRITEYVAGLLARWVDLTEDEEDTSPWSSGPLIEEAAGPFLYFPMRTSMAEEASAYAAELAAAMGLVCYDPQTRRMRS
ncbi:hypothetical protein [Streptomyces sparsus]